MSRILLIAWNENEARERARRLSGYGHEVKICSSSESTYLRRVRTSPPELFIIDLNRLPSHGRELAAYFRRQKATRMVPILFAGGDRDRVEIARKLLPDAHFAEWKDIRSAIQRARRNPPTNPLVPSTTAAYSLSPLPKKLGIRENHAVGLFHAPEQFERQLEPRPRGVEIVTEPGHADVALLFVSSEAELARELRPLKAALPAKAALWIAWPKQTSGVPTDLKETIVREFGLGAGLVDYKVCSINQTWSGLCFAQKK